MIKPGMQALVNACPAGTATYGYLGSGSRRASIENNLENRNDPMLAPSDCRVCYTLCKNHSALRFLLCRSGHQKNANRAGYLSRDTRPSHWRQHSVVVTKEAPMKPVLVIALVSMFAVGASLFAAGPASAETACEMQAVGKDGKPLAGAAKASFLKKCEEDACTPKAVGSDGKPLAGAAKASFLKKCENDA
jgi:hypothetical protein